MDLKQLASSLDQIAEEKAIPRETVVETVETALAAAYKKDYGDRGQNVRVDFDTDTGAMRVFQEFLVVDESMIESEEDIERKRALREAGEEPKEDDEKKVRFNPQRHMMLEEAAELDDTATPGEDIAIELDPPEEFGRIAAQTAKQVIIQRLREAERDAVYEEYKDKEDEVVSGVVQRLEGDTVFMDIGKTIGVLYSDEQIPGEYHRIGERFRVYVARVERGNRGPSIILSRKHPKLVSKLFTIEVPEIAAETVDIKSVAREAGARSKIAVWTEEEGVDPVGSCIGQKGTRVQTVINELGGEKIDIIEWDPDPAQFIANALSPAKVLYVDLDEDNHTAVAVVADDQLSLAIGRKGQNVRLAAKLSGWRIDIKSEEEMHEMVEQRKRELRGEEMEEEEHAAAMALEDLPGIGAKTAEALRAAGFASIGDIAVAGVEDLADVDGIGEATAETIMDAALSADTGEDVEPKESDEPVQDDVDEEADNTSEEAVTEAEDHDPDEDSAEMDEEQETQEDEPQE